MQVGSHCIDLRKNLNDAGQFWWDRAKKIPLPGGRSETPGLLLIVNRQALYRFKKKS